VLACVEQGADLRGEGGLLTFEILPTGHGERMPQPTRGSEPLCSPRRRLVANRGQ
jgi:hypothetical protein